MAQSCSGWCWQLRLASSLAMGGAIAFFADCARAQITPDDTLGAERSVVTPLNPQVDRIEGGAIRGANLFHSFLEFNVGEGQEAKFTIPAGIENILSRVTGGNPSNILGTLGVSGGNANLFLINPNGIIFGPNASLDVKGSFMATTANAVRLGETGLFSASEPAASNLLTVRPSALFFNAVAAQAIVNQSQAQSLIGQPNSLDGPVGLQVPTGQTLALVGGDVVVSGGNLTAAGGRIELGSVAAVGEVSLNQRGNSWVIGYDRVDAFGDIRLGGGAVVDVSCSGGGDVQIQGAQLDMTEGSFIFADTLGTGAGGEVLVHTTEVIALSDDSLITAYVYGSGTGGDLTIETEQFSVRDGAVVSAGTFSDEGRGGNLTVTAEESVELVGWDSGLYTQTEGAGSTGDLTLATRQLSVRDGAVVSAGTYLGSEGKGGDLTVTAEESVELVGWSSGLYTQTEGAGSAGDLTLATRQLSVRDGAVVSTGTYPGSEGKGGNLTVTAEESVELVGSDSGLYSQTEGTGSAGDLTLATRQLSVRDGAVVSASTFGPGKGGELRVNASNSVNLFGVDRSGYSSGLFTSTSGVGQGGNITVDTSAFQVADGAVVSARTIAGGNGGNIKVNASTFEAVKGGQVLTTTRSSGLAGNISFNVTDSVTLSGSDPTFAERRAELGDDVNNEGSASGLFANTAPGSTRQGGDLTVVTGKLMVRDGAGVSVSSEGSGNAGKLNVTARSVSLDNQGKLTSETASGQGGDIKLKVQDLLLLRRSSNISTTAGLAGTGGDGGNITINTPFIVTVPSENSDIMANAFEGNGGNIQITAQGIFGTQFREDEPSQSDITASSEFGVDGVVEINTPDIDPSRGLVALPAQLVDVAGLIAQGCPAGGGDVARGESEFIVTGRGGLPPQPSEALRTSAVVVNRDTLEAGVENRSREVTSTPTQLVEAQGWVVNAQGQVVLTAQAPTVTPHSPWSTPTTCHAH